MVTFPMGKKLVAIVLLMLLHLLAAEIHSSFALRPYSYNNKEKTSMQISRRSEANGRRKMHRKSEDHTVISWAFIKWSSKRSLPTRAPPPPMVN